MARSSKKIRIAKYSGTCGKQGVSFFKYLRGIFSNRYSMPRLSELAGGV
ncbi:MAG: hypothetical protein J7J03_05930 [Methanosarcinales archaeon]|nr:hypothetical protein [Methanosarcinales archaeon]